MSRTTPAGLTLREQNRLVALLEQLGPPPWPLAVFNALTSRMTVLAFECVVLRRSGPLGIEVYLLRRPDGDTYWPGQLSCPGTVMLTTDQPTTPMFQGILDRLALKELGTIFSRTEFLDIRHPGESGRANTVQLAYFGETAAAPSNGQWHSVVLLPDNLVQGHADMIAAAVTRFKRSG